MDIHTWLKNATRLLTESSVASARLDTEILLADILEKDRSWVLAHPEHVLHDEQLILLNKKVARRTNHEPLAYIRDKQEFYGRDFTVTPDTLTPRPETETLLEVLFDIIEPDQTIIDIGTGSGCIAITAKLELPSSTVYATDISESALDVAKQNATRLQADVTFMHEDIMSRLDANVIEGAILCCNLPYVPVGYPINEAAKHEPPIALFSGADGLDHYRALFNALAMLELRGQSPSNILTECLLMQHEQLTQIAAKSGFKLQKTQDLIQAYVKA